MSNKQKITVWASQKVYLGRYETRNIGMQVEREVEGDLETEINKAYDEIDALLQPRLEEARLEGEELDKQATNNYKNKKRSDQKEKAKKALNKLS